MTLPIGLLAFFIAVGDALDRSLAPPHKESLSDLIETTVPPYTLDWYRAVNERFQMLFDEIYGYENTQRQRLVWLGILGSYFSLFVARVILWAFDIEIPDTTYLLTTAFLVPLAAFFLVYGTFGSEEIVSVSETVESRLRMADSPRIEYAYRTFLAAVCVGLGTGMIAFSVTVSDSRLVLLMGLFVLACVTFPIVAVGLLPESTYPIDGAPDRWWTLVGVVLVALGIGLYVGLVANATLSMGGTPVVVVAMSVGMAAIVPFAHVALAVQEYFHKINPIRAIVSSIAFVFLVGTRFPDAGRAFVSEIWASGFLVLSYLAFNVFADAVSLIETKWILGKSQSVSRPALVFLLLSDVVLSAVIYLLLPLFVGQDLSVFVAAVQFSGPSPWMGILFWSTFSTSAIFYLFVVAVFTLQLLWPVTRFFKRVGEVIEFEDHPATFLAFTVDSIIVLIHAVGRVAG